MGKFSRLGNELYNGRRSVDFIGKAMVWYLISAVLVLASVGIVVGKGLNLGVEFTGGTQFSVALPADQVDETTADELRVAASSSGIEGTDTPTVTTSGDTAIIVQVEPLDTADVDALLGDLSDTAGVDPDAVSVSEIGPSLGAQIAQRALLGIVIFLVLVVLFIWAYFREWKMSIAALIALFHDIALTVGIYALSGFSVTPSAVTGLLAILGFSLYDTVVVFDKVKENTRNLRQSRMSYAAAANLAVNQTLVRSINTAIVALIPIGAILWVSAVQLGASSLQDLALSQFVGMAVGVYSSIALAPRVLVALKSREDEVKLAERRAKARARNDVDPYAAVPAFADDMAIQDPDEPGSGARVRDAGDEEAEPRLAPSRPAGGRPSTTRPGSGRTAPTPRGQMGPSGSAGRQQPRRQSKSQREK